MENQNEVQQLISQHPVLTNRGSELYLHLHNNHIAAVLEGRVYSPTQQQLAEELDVYQPNISVRLKRLSELNLIRISDFRLSKVLFYSIVPLEIGLVLLDNRYKDSLAA
jgi:DNA-binding transcriptional ArsR family regulator